MRSDNTNHYRLGGLCGPVQVLKRKVDQGRDRGESLCFRKVRGRVLLHHVPVSLLIFLTK